MKPVAVYDGHTMKRLAYLQNAYDIHYEKSVGALWTAGFSMPYSDEKNIYCAAFNLIELWDVDGGNADKYVGLFRIMPRVEETLGTEANVEYELEHVLTTLLDDVLLGWHEIGNIGVYTPQVIAYILDRQSQPRWVLEQCDYSHQFLYGWQDENLLSALYSVVAPFSETDYYWDFDTVGYPWRLRLLRTSKVPITDIRYRKNLSGVTRKVDPTNLTTRLYCYGYGEGDNKLTIKNVNNGIPYLESPNVGKYGVITQVWTDERFTVEESLKTIGQAMLKKLEEPAITYELDVQTIFETANLTVGDTARVVTSGLDEYMVVQKISKSNVSGANRTGKIILGTGTVDVSQSMADMANKQRISETYSQGAESIFTDSAFDNADAANPCEITFTIPENAVHVNEIRFSARLASFRAYSKATQGGGAGTETSSSGGSSNQTSSSGGGSNQTSSYDGGSNTTSSGGGNTSTTTGSGGSQVVTSNTGGSATPTSSSGGSTSVLTTLYDSFSGDAEYETNYIQPAASPVLTQGSFVVGSTNQYNHNHAFRRHKHSLLHNHTVNIGSHTHSVSVPAHSHGLTLPDHTHSITIGSHTHTVSIGSHTHSVSIPSHTHSVSIPSHTHNLTLPNHTHQIEYGIYKGPSASSMLIYLDNTLIGSYGSSVSNINLISYMSKDANGSVLRGQHTIKITPSGLTRVECTFQIRLFTNAHGGSQY